MNAYTASALLSKFKLHRTSSDHVISITARGRR